MINSINTNKNNLSYGAVKDYVPDDIKQNLPESIQNIDAGAAINDSDFANALKGMELTPVSFFSMFPVWFGLMGASSLVNKTYRGEYKDSSLGKLGAFGDKVNNKFYQTFKPICDFVSNNTNKFSNFMKEKLPFINTLTRPESNFAKGMEFGVTSLNVNDTKGLIEEITRNMKDEDVVKMFNKNKTELHQMLEKISQNPKESGAEIKELIDILNKNKDKKYNFKPLGSFFGTKTSDEEALKKPLNKFRSHFNPTDITDETKGKFKLFSRDVTLGEMANKLTATSQKFMQKDIQTNKTLVGKILPRLQATFHEAMTNGFSGGKIMIIMQAFIIAQAIQKAIDAPDGEKVSAFMETLSYDLGFFVTMPLQVLSAHIPGSMKYIGMGSNSTDQKKAVQMYRDKLKFINENVDNMSHADYDRMVKELKEMLNKNITTNTKVKWWQKPFKAIGKLFTLGLEKPKPYTKDLNNGFSKLLKKIGYQSKWIGGIGRLGLAIFVVAPFLASLFARGSHLVFGRPTKSVLDKEQDEENVNAINNEQNANEILSKYNMTEEDFLNKIQEHPEIIVDIQKDPELYKKFTENPYILIEMLANKEQQNGNKVVQNEVIKTETPKNNTKRSPILDE